MKTSEMKKKRLAGQGSKVKDTSEVKEAVLKPNQKSKRPEPK